MNTVLINIQNLVPGDWIRVYYGCRLRDFCIIDNNLYDQTLSVLLRGALEEDTFTLKYGYLIEHGYAFIGNTAERMWRRLFPGFIRSIIPAYPYPK